MAVASALLRIGNIYTHLQAPPAQFEEVRASFRFPIKDWEYLQRKKPWLARHGWSGLQDFVDNNGRFPTGLLPEVAAKLRSMGVAVEQTDERPPVETAHIAEITPDILRLPMADGGAIGADAAAPPPPRLHDYQVDIAKLALEERRGIIKCATGGGKTVIFASLLKALGPQTPTVVLFRSAQLVQQTYEVLRRCGIARVGRVNQNHCEVSPELQVVCSTIQSSDKLGALVKRARALIVDEVHEFTSPLSVRALRAFDGAAWRLGFSATPFKDDDLIHNYRLKSWFGPLLCDVTTQSLMSQNILADADCRFHTISGPRGIRTLPWAEAEERGYVQNDELNQAIVRLVAAIPEGRIMVLVKRISHGDQLAALIPAAHWVKGADTAETRAYVIDQLRTARNRKVVAICSSIFNVGVDVMVHHLINATGGRDAGLTIQRLGRGLRRAPDKSHVVYHDFFHLSNPYLTAHSRHRIQTLLREGHRLTVPPEAQSVVDEEMSGAANAANDE